MQGKRRTSTGKVRMGGRGLGTATLDPRKSRKTMGITRRPRKK